MNKNPAKFRVSDLNRLLTQMNTEGGFHLSVLTDLQGFSIAFAANEKLDPDKQAAVIALIQKMTVQVSKQLGMGLTEEIMIHDTDGHCLVCRPFAVSGYSLILGIMLNSRQQPYRRLTNRAIQDICQVWSD
jgi:predicted regulator of Ras-like GTPase activity (Roadblock/LC7/MglB family)